MPEPLLTAIGKELSVRSARAAKTGEGVLDERTFNTIEVDRLFDAVNCAGTVAGQATLYRSLAHPLSSIEAITAKQDALKELDSRPICGRGSKRWCSMLRNTRRIFIVCCLEPLSAP